MKLTPNEQSVLHALTTEWQTPIQIADQLPSWKQSEVNQSLKNLMRKDFVQANSVVFGMYRLTSEGSAAKATMLGE
ncbi:MULTISPECIES: hypothetical protein [Heyndrickxia]|jgi:predicted transcriptional regulator|uniref:hypothetical protein n=1 Tax=Heyndrickxia TaxID=2837504 RepID=UPI001B0F6F0D|nr:hypothetical protein [Heyndrickxia oleronia]GIN38792.1 hypothetical protein J19TS1_17410 [Heyndrickxia oleronia]